MKLRKAVEKATMERQGLEKEHATGGEGIVAPQTPSEIIGRLTPHYTKSQPVQIDMQIARENRLVCLFPDAAEIESYKMLRTQILRKTREKGLNTLMITSVLPGEGKTTTSINTALTLAKEFNQTVLLVDCDLRHQKIHKYMGISSGKGLIDYLMENRSLEELILWPGIDGLTMISGGKTIRDSSELLGSPKMKALVTEMKHKYEDRYIILDVPPLLSTADAMTFAQLVDNFLIVVEAGRTSLRDIKKALELIPHEKFLGFVLNRHGDAKIKAYG